MMGPVCCLYDEACVLFIRWGLFVYMMGPVCCLYDEACVLFI